MYIALAEPLSGKRSKKIRFSLDDGSNIVLYKREAKRFGLEEGDEISEELWGRLMDEVFIPRARSRAMHLLEKQDRTVAGLRRKLCEAGYPERAIDAAIAYVESYHYLDDGRYAASYVRYHQYGKSRRRIRMDLRSKGISDELIDRAIETEFTNSEEDMIRAAVAKRGYDAASADLREKQKLYRFLLGRGFSYESIDRAIMDRDRE